MNFAEKVLTYQFGLRPDVRLPGGVEFLFPAAQPEVKATMTEFYRRYYNDSDKRIALLGINPGRFGAGITGIPFTDPIRLREVGMIEHDFRDRAELSSIFVYEVIEAMGGLVKFCETVYITSICPLGFVKDGKNYNYYDDPKLYQAVKEMILENLEELLASGVRRDIAFSMGKGTNFKYLQKLNKEYGFFESVEPLPHPRWVMQYRLKRKEEFVTEYKEKIERWT